MIGRVAAILDGRERIEIRKWAARLNVPGPRSPNLILIGDYLEVRALGTGIGNFQGDLRRKRLLDGQVPLLVIGSLQPAIHAGDWRIYGICGIDRRKATRHREDRRDAIADEQGPREERNVVGQLERSRGANFLSTIENAVGATEYAFGVVKWAPCKTDARRNIVMVNIHESARGAIPVGDDYRGRGVVKITLLVVDLHDGREIIVADAQIQSEMPVHLEIILDENVRNVLTVTEIQQGGNAGGQRKAEQFVSDGTAGFHDACRIGGKLTRESKSPVGVGHLEDIEFAPAHFRANFYGVSSAGEAEGIANLTFLAGKQRGSERRVARAAISVWPEKRDAVGGRIVRYPGDAQFGRR